MRQASRILAVFALLLLVACQATAQEAGHLVATEAPRRVSRGFMEVVLSGGVLGLLNWAGIFFWSMLSLPLGILSIVHCATCRKRQFPLATKVLAVGAVWVFVLGWSGVAQATIFAFSGLATLAPGTPDVGALALSISQAVFSMAGRYWSARSTSSSS